MYDKYQLITALATLSLVVVVVLAHYEGMHYFSNWIQRTRVRPRFRIVVLIYGLLILHGIEAILFGLAYYWMGNADGFGNVIGSTPLQMRDYLYFSATVYSTVGFGDLFPTGSLRLVAGVEGVTGLLMITWSASFTYLEMVRYWRDND